MNERGKEIEAKAWITTQDEKRVVSFLEQNTHFCGEVCKKDVMFWKNENHLDAFRIRSINEQTIITRKKRAITEEGIEINEEIEFPILHSQGFEQMMQSFGYELWYEKQKNIRQYSNDSLLYELVKIPLVGTFLEIERVSDDTSASIAKIQDIFIMLHLPIEPRPYAEIIKTGSLISPLSFTQPPLR